MLGIFVKSTSKNGNPSRTVDNMSSDDDVVAGIDGTEFRLGVVIEAEAITVTERASSLTMSPDHLEGEHPRRSAEKQFLYAIYRQAQAASVTAADLQQVDRDGGDCEDVEASAEPPTSDDKSIFLTGKWNLYFPAWRILWRASHAS
jgi:hypothetical protein